MSTVTEIETTIGRTTNNGPSITRIWHCGQHTVRARVDHDSYQRQSYALAEVLTPALTWTLLCTTPAHEFHADSLARDHKPKPTEAELLQLADELMRRACQILRVTDIDSTAPVTSQTGPGTTR